MATEPLFHPVTRRQFNIMEKWRERLGVVSSGIDVLRLSVLHVFDPHFNHIKTGEWEVEVIRQDLFQKARSKRLTLSWAEAVQILKHVAVFHELKLKPNIQENDAGTSPQI